VSGPEQLFERLLREENLISYIGAFETLLGTRPRPFRHRRDCRPVLRLALQTTPRVFRGLLIQLDALIVEQKRRRPGAGHFRGKTYSEAAWLQVFEDWPLC
jgi:hypothetical protein